MRLIWKRDRLQEWRAFTGLQVGKGRFREQRRLERLAREGDSNEGKRAAQPRGWASCGPRADPGVRLIRASSQAHLGQSGLEGGNFLGGWKLNGGRGAGRGLSRARGTGHTAGARRGGETQGEPTDPDWGRGCQSGAAGSGWRPPSGTHAEALALTIGRPVRGQEKLPGSVNRRAVGEGAGRGHQPTEPGGWAGGVTCVRESWAAAAMVFPSCTGGEGRTGGWGLGAGRRRRERPEARPGRAGGRASPLTSTTSLLSPAPPRMAPPAPRRPWRHPNPGAGFRASRPEPKPGAAWKKPAWKWN